MGLYHDSKADRPSVFTNMYLSIRQIAEQLQSINELPDAFHPGGPYIPGIKKFFITVDGEFYPCESAKEAFYQGSNFKNIYRKKPMLGFCILFDKFVVLM